MSPRKSAGCFVVRNNGRLEYRFFYTRKSYIYKIIVDFDLSLVLLYAGDRMRRAYLNALIFGAA